MVVRSRLVFTTVPPGDSSWREGVLYNVLLCQQFVMEQGIQSGMAQPPLRYQKRFF
jgi:hypothetical protein